MTLLSGRNMYLKIILFAFAFVVTANVIHPKETVNACVTLSIPEEELNFLRNLSGKMEVFLERNLEDGHKNLMKVLTQYGVDDEGMLKLDRNAPLESSLLQYQIIMHRDMKRMFLEMKTLVIDMKSWKGITSKADNEVLGPDFFSKTSQLHSKDTLKLHNEISNSTVKFRKQSDASSLSFWNKGFYSPTDFEFRPEDCSEILVAGRKKSGVYQIYPFRCRCSPPVEVFCDMETDGGGWTIFLARNNQSKHIDFKRNWEDYKNGFGSPEEEYWLGNDVLHVLTHNRKYVMRLEAKDGFGRGIWGEWNTFIVGSEDEKYNLTARDFNDKSTAFDRFTTYHNGNSFTTFDMDTDRHAKMNCAEKYKGGWWYNACYRYNPTGIHGQKGDESIQLVPWSKKDSTNRFANWIQLKLRPETCNNLVSVAKFNTHNCAFN